MTDDGPDRDAEELLEELRRMVDEEPDLVPTEPREAFEMWIEQLDLAESTIRSYRYRVRPFLEFCDERAITNLNHLSTRDIKEFEGVRRSAGLVRQTINNQFGTLRQYLRYCEDLEAVTEEVPKALDIPSLSKEERVNTEKLIYERAQKILDDLKRYRYASREHVLFLLLWRSTLRIGAIHSLDLVDVYTDEGDRERLRQHLAEQGHPRHVVDEILDGVELPFIIPRHRPEQDTRLKNAYGGERVINIAPWVGETIEDYIQVNRYEVTDEHGRRPLLTTRKGDCRLSKSAMRNWTYILTQPCEFGGPCPHDRDPETCEAREHGHGSKCPSSRSPHKLRTGSITWHRDRRWSISDVADKANSGEDLVKGVYDQPEQLTRGASRRSELSKLDPEEDHESNHQ
jgi:integrase